MEELDNDWRMQDVHFSGKDWTSPWTGQVVPKGSQITFRSITQLTKEKQLCIALPNATALCLSSSMRAWKEAQEIRKKANIDSSIKEQVTFNTTSESFDYIERVMESIVMAFTALEAFVNENIPDDYEYHIHRKSEIILEVMDKKAIERWLSLDEKLSVVLPEAISVDSPKGRAVGCGDERNRINRERCGSFLTTSYKAAIQGWLNTAVKGMHRPMAVLKVGF
ncbi:hypothetical protein [Methylobacter luteus]|uniref:hypothetical protein n=1 Tax=Methylobacter luteus TaxID=415 RepID=UPI00055EBF18|nr:hypothetical protein [Methylobacter luteus]